MKKTKFPYTVKLIYPSGAEDIVKIKNLKHETDFYNDYNKLKKEGYNVQINK
jgi:hypothetical protein